MIHKEATQVGHPVIRAKAKKVVDATSVEIQKNIEDLVDSMRHHELVGMAAPQIGVGVRVFVTEIRKTKLRKTEADGVDGLRVFVNPKIISISKKMVEGWEGCGSVACAGLFGKVKRPEKVVVEALNEKGEKFTLAAHGLLARVIQHETDHLNGMLFVDAANSKTFMSRSEYLKMKSKG